MSRPQKLIFGVRPEKKWFRLMDHIGEIIEAVLKTGDSKNFPPNFFTEIRRGQNVPNLSLRDKASQRTLTISEDNFVFACDSYDTEARRIDFDECYSQLSELWAAFAKILDHGGIRRIGLVAEFRFESETGSSSATLLHSLTKVKRDNSVGKFLLQFQNMRRLPGDKSTDPIVEERDAFINVIDHYYDGLLDAEHPMPNCWNASIDYQHYFSPALKKNIPEEIFKMRGPFLAELARLKGDLNSMNLKGQDYKRGQSNESTAAARFSKS